MTPDERAGKVVDRWEGTSRDTALDTSRVLFVSTLEWLSL